VPNLWIGSAYLGIAADRPNATDRADNRADPNRIGDLDLAQVDDHNAGSQQVTYYVAQRR
jgi:hypothetical protein